MRVNLTDKELKHCLDLSAEEIVQLLRYRRPTPTTSKFKVISPVLLVIGDKKFQSDILRMEASVYSSDEPTDESFYPEEGLEGEPWIDGNEESKKRRGKKSDPVAKIDPFTATLELTPEMFSALVGSKEIMVLMRVNNMPVYCVTKYVKVDYNLAVEVRDGEKNAPCLEVKIERVRPIVDLLKAQITEAQFSDCFIVGKSEEFYDATGEDLEEIVALIGIRRKTEETDIALRKRVMDYLKLRLEALSKIKDEDLNAIVEEQAEKERIEERINEADKRRKEKDDEKR